MSEPDDLRARESAILRALDEGRSELEQLADEIASLETALPGLRERAELALRHATEVKKKEYDTPAKVIITVCVVPVAILLGVVAALFGWMFVAIPGLVFELDPGLMLHVLPALMGVFGLCGGVYAALKIWG